MQPLRGLSWAGTAYHLVVILAGAAFVPISLTLFPLRSSQVGELLYLAAFTQVAALMPIRWHRGVQFVDTLPLIAVALYAPGSGIALVSWLCTFDGRRPSADFALWKLLYNRARTALEFGVPSILITLAPLPADFAVPIKTMLLAAGTLLIGYPLTAGALAYFHRENFWTVLWSNVGFSSVRSVVILAIGGGALFIVLQVGGGFLMGIGLLGLLLAVRSNMLDAQRQHIERIQTLELIAQTLDARDSMTELHSQRVSDLATRLAEVLGLGSLDLERIRVAGLLHDVGKIGVPDAVLKKPGPLSHDEWIQMRRHPDVGADLIARHSALEPMAPSVRYHHERWNGTGYPLGLVAAQAPLGARILAVADSFDTITGPRIYRRSVMSPLEAIEEISSGAGVLYDVDVVNALRSLHGLPDLRTDVSPEADRRSDEAATGFVLLRRRPGFRWLSAGMAVSSIGDPLTAVAIVVSAYSITRSPAVVAALYVLRAGATLGAVGTLGGLADRLDRRHLIISADLGRAACLLGLPLAAALSPWWLLPAVVLLGVAGGLSQAAREAAMPGLVRPQELGAANGIVGSAITGGQAIGYPVAAAILWLTASTTALFLIDAVTFIGAALLTMAAGNLGGQITARSVTGAIRAAWSVGATRGPLVVAGAGAFLIAMTIPTLVVVAYELSKTGARTYTILEVVLTAGMVSGAVVMAYSRRAPQGAAVTGLAVMGILSMIVGFSSSVLLTAALLFAASVGNQLYVVANRTQLQQAATGDRRGSIMATRAVVAEACVILGSAIGGVIAGASSGRTAYAFAGLGMLTLGCLLAFRAMSAARAADGTASAGLLAGDLHQFDTADLT